MVHSGQASARLGPDRLGIIGGAGGIALTAAILLFAARRLTFTYQPYGGVVGLPAILNYPPQQELFFYFSGLIAIFLGGLAGRWLGRRFNLLALGILLAGAALFAASLIGNTAQTAVLIKSIARSSAAGEFLLFILFALPLFLISDAAEINPEKPSDFGVWIALVGPIWVHESILLSVYLPAWPVALGLAAGFAYVEGWLLIQNERPRRGRNILMYLEAAAWVVLALVPIAAWIFRLGLALERPVPSPRAMALIGLVTVCAPLLFGALRARLRYKPLVRPAALVPFSVLALLGLAPGVQTSFDAFHMGELMYPATAFAAGLKPWTDIFYVHGFGVDTIFGALFPATERLHAMVLHTAGLSAATGVAIGVWAMLRLWGGRWWLLALVVGALAFEGSGWSTCRYLPMWIVLLLIAEFARAARVRWLVLAGAVAWLGAFFSLDTGSTLLAALFFFSILWGVFGAQAVAHRIQPLLAYLFGVALAAIPTLLWMLYAGVLGDFVKVNWEYMLVKRHYDKIPIDIKSLVVFVAPAVTLAGAWASLTILRRGERTPLAAAILLLTIVTPLAYLRAFDRSDFGHQIYGAVPAWPLLACLLVWWASRSGGPSSSSALWRSALFSLLLIAYPFAHPLLSRQPEGDPLVFRINDYLRNFYVDSRLPLFAAPEDPQTIGIFNVARAIDALPGDEALYDFSNQPALYALTGRTCPTRFFVPFYASGEKWQDEVIGALDRRQVPWVLWRGPTEYWNAPDFIPTCVRQWKIASYIVSHYRPARVLSGNSILLARNDASNTFTALGREIWITPAEVNLQSLPKVWGKNETGVPKPPSRRIDQPITIRQFSGTHAMDLPASLGEATELWVSFSKPPSGPFTTQWFDRGGNPAPPVCFDPSPDFKGPYRVMLSNMPHWAWSGPPSRIRFTTLPTDLELTIEFKKSTKQEE